MSPSGAQRRNSRERLRSYSRREAEARDRFEVFLDWDEQMKELPCVCFNLKEFEATSLAGTAGKNVGGLKTGEGTVRR